MTTRASVASFFLLATLVSAAAHAAASPADLASRIEKALESGDGDAILAEVHLEQAPAMALFMLLDLPNDCGADVVCSVSAEPLDEEWKAAQMERMAEQGAEMPIAPDGMIVIRGRSTDETEGESSLTVRLPHARVNGAYRVVAGRLTAAKLAELEATTAQAAADATLAGGIYDPTVGERDLEWKGKATALPAGGGEAGAAFLAKVTAMAAAVAARDVDAAAAAGGDWGRIVLGPTDYAGNPVPLAARQRKLRAQAVRFVLSAQVPGGYQLGDTALLVIEGTNGAGNVVRGAQIMTREDGVWTDAGHDLVEIPAAR